MKKSLTKNYIYNLLYQILIIILPFVTAPYIARVLGAENVGIYSYTLSISAFFILFGSLGIALYGQREVAYFQNNAYERTKTFWEIVIFRFITMLISLLIFYFVFVFKGNDYNLYYKILMLEIIGNAIDISWFLQGLEEFKRTVTRNFLVKIVSLICVFTFVKSKEDLDIYFLIYVLSIVIGNISLWLYLPKYLTKIKILKLNIFKHFKPTMQLFIPQIAIQVYTIMDRTMIGALIDNKSEVGYYEQAQKIIKILLSIITSLTAVMLPRIANTFANGEKNKINNYIMKSFNMVFLISFPLIFGISVISKEFVPLFFGNGYEKVSLLMNVISPIILFIGLSSVIGNQYLLPTQRQKEYTTSVLFGSIVNLIINLLLIPKLGALGASIGTVVAEFTVIAIQIYFTKNDFEWKKVIKIPVNYFISGLIMFLCCMSIGKLIDNSLISVIVKIIIGVIIYFILLFIMKDKLLKEILNKLKHIKSK